MHHRLLEGNAWYDEAWRKDLEAFRKQYVELLVSEDQRIKNMENTVAMHCAAHRRRVALRGHGQAVLGQE